MTPHEWETVFYRARLRTLADVGKMSDIGSTYKDVYLIIADILFNFEMAFSDLSLLKGKKK